MRFATVTAMSAAAIFAVAVPVASAKKRDFSADDSALTTGQPSGSGWVSAFLIKSTKPSKKPGGKFQAELNGRVQCFAYLVPRKVRSVTVNGVSGKLYTFKLRGLRSNGTLASNGFCSDPAQRKKWKCVGHLSSDQSHWLWTTLLASSPSATPLASTLAPLRGINGTSL